MKLIITRHGETEENKQGILQGHLPGKLSAEGKIQAKKVALRLKDEKIDFIFSSDLRRAADTAQEIAKFHPAVTIEYTRELRERNMGEFEGKKKSELGWSAKEFKAIILQPQKGETMEQVYDRAKSLIQKVYSDHPNDTVLFVGHNGINKSLIAAITDKKHDQIKTIETQHNTSINEFEIAEDGKHEIRVLNCIKHLD